MPTPQLRDLVPAARAHAAGRAALFPELVHTASGSLDGLVNGLDVQTDADRLAALVNGLDSPMAKSMDSHEFLCPFP